MTNKERTDYILQRIEDGKTLSEVGFHLGISKQRVGQIIEAAGQNASLIKDGRILRRILDGDTSDSQLTRELRCSLPRIREIRSQYGIEKSPYRVQKYDDRNQQIIDMLLDGKTYREVANKFGFSINHIFRIAKNKVPSRPRGRRPA